MNFIKSFLLFSLIFIISPYINAENERIIIKLWCEKEPFVSPDDSEFPLMKETAIKRHLEEARIIISSMIYGFSFSYIPFDKKRKVDEQFILNPIAEIKWGDRNLRVISTKLIDKRYYSTITYDLYNFQIQRIQAWNSNTIPKASGSGEGDIFKGYKQKQESFKNSIKLSVKNYLSPQIFNKPREIKGEVLIMEYPKTKIIAGTYITEVKIKLNVKEIIPYKIF